MPTDPLVQKARRQRLLLLALVNSLILGSGIVTAIDLRRLATPGGTALRWAEAAVFGVCSDYLEFSVAAPDTADPRSEEDLCEDLTASTEEARTQAHTIGLRLGPVTERGTAATAAITLTRAGEDAQLQIHLVRRDGRWRVLRDDATCASVGCA